MLKRAVFALLALALLAVMVAALAPALTWAQRREGNAASALAVTLPSAVRFGAVALPAGSYRLYITDAGLAFADPRTMVTVATVAVERLANDTPTAQSTLELREQGKEVRLRVLTASEVLTALGERLERMPNAVGVEYATKAEAALGAHKIVDPDDVVLVDAVLRRYLVSIQDCADSAHRGRWSTDDPRFQKCVCPIAEKWRLPRVHAELRLHRHIDKGHAGVSLTVLPDGRVQNCRVYMGPKSPEENAVVPGSSAAPAAAPLEPSTNTSPAKGAAVSPAPGAPPPVVAPPRP